MNDRERLIKILEKAPKSLRYEDLPDYLLENGIIVLPCRCDKCSHRCNDTNECGIYGRICTENGYCDKALKGYNENE